MTAQLGSHVVSKCNLVFKVAATGYGKLQNDKCNAGGKQKYLFLKSVIFLLKSQNEAEKKSTKSFFDHRENMAPSHQKQRK